MLSRGSICSLKFDVDLFIAGKRHSVSDRKMKVSLTLSESEQPQTAGVYLWKYCGARLHIDVEMTNEFSRWQGAIVLIEHQQFNPFSPDQFSRRTAFGRDVH